MSCPVCFAKEVVPVFTVKDCSVSQEDFALLECTVCTARFTQNAPNASEIGRYYASDDYISHSDTQKGLINSLYHIIRKRSLVRKRMLVEWARVGMGGEEKAIVGMGGEEKTKGDTQKDSRFSILDIGCGTGAFLHEMKQNGWIIRGLEPDEKARAIARQKHQIEAENPEKLFQLPKNSVDVVSMWHVLEHVHELQDYLVKIREILSKNGILVIAVPNYTSFDATYYQEKWAAYDVPRHLYHFSPKAMEILLQKHGFQLRNCQKMPFDSFYVSMLSEKYKNNGKLSILGLIKAVWIGAKSNIKTIGNPKKCSSVIYVAS